MQELEPGSSFEKDVPHLKEKSDMTDRLFDLTPEQQIKADAAMVAMGEKFGVPIEDFSLLRTKAEDGSDVFTVAYTAEVGLDLGDPEKGEGNWSGLFDEGVDEDFMIEIDGEKIDTRRGMTKEVYDMFIAQAKVKGVYPLPDREDGVRSKKWSDTWLTGEYSDEPIKHGSREFMPGSRFAYVQEDGQIYFGMDGHSPGYFELTGKSRAVRHKFRPAVPI